MFLSLRRMTEERWAIAVCTASAGNAYHPQYRRPLQAEDEFDHDGFKVFQGEDLFDDGQVLDL